MRYVRAPAQVLAWVIAVGLGVGLATCPARAKPRRRQDPSTPGCARVAAAGPADCGGVSSGTVDSVVGGSGVLESCAGTSEGVSSGGRETKTALDTTCATGSSAQVQLQADEVVVQGFSGIGLGDVRKVQGASQVSDVKLRGNVRLWWCDLWLRAQAVHMDGTGLRAEGPGLLSLCACEKAPVLLGFRRVQVARSGDIELVSPYVRVGKVPIGWLPWLWLRPRDKVAFLWPKLGWRGDGGLFVGSGVHIPWRDGRGQLAWADVSVAGYSRGGGQLEVDVRTPGSASLVRWDKMGGELLRVRSGGVYGARGAHGAGERAGAIFSGGVGWYADVSQGSRGASGLVVLNEGAKPNDEGWLHLDVRPDAQLFLRTGVAVAGPRAALSRRADLAGFVGLGGLAVGPQVLLDANGVVSRGLTWRVGADFLRLEGTQLANIPLGWVNADQVQLGWAQEGADARAFQLAGVRAEVAAAHWFGPVRARVSTGFSVADELVTTRAVTAQNRTQTVDTTRRYGDFAVGAFGELAMVLVRNYDIVQHEIEPYVGAMLLEALGSDVTDIGDAGNADYAYTNVHARFRPAPMTSGHYVGTWIGGRTSFGRAGELWQGRFNASVGTAARARTGFGDRTTRRSEGPGLPPGSDGDTVQDTVQDGVQGVFGSGGEEFLPPLIFRGTGGVVAGYWRTSADVKGVTEAGKTGYSAVISTGISTVVSGEGAIGGGSDAGVVSARTAKHMNGVGLPAGSEPGFELGVDLSTRSHNATALVWMLEQAEQPFGAIRSLQEVSQQLSVSGTSLGMFGGLAFGAGVQWQARLDWDVTTGRWLSHGTGLVWTHPCGCFQGHIGMSQRRGRPGLDGWVGVQGRM